MPKTLPRTGAGFAHEKLMIELSLPDRAKLGHCIDAGYRARCHGVDFDANPYLWSPHRAGHQQSPRDFELNGLRVEAWWNGWSEAEKQMRAAEGVRAA